MSQSSSKWRHATCLVVLCWCLVVGSSTAGASKVPLNGERLFNDTRLSADGSTACATCHSATHAFADPNATSRGAFGQQGTRNAPSLQNIGAHSQLFWDGRRGSIDELLLDPLTHPREHGLCDAKELVNKVVAFYTREDLQPITFLDVTSTLASYVLSLSMRTSPYDRYLAGDATALTESQRHGLQLFRGRAQCSTCHAVEDGTFSDGRFHAGQLADGTERRLGPAAKRIASLDREQRYRAIADDKDVSDLGRFVVTLVPRDVGTFLTPSLRNVAVTAPYMHDGHVDDLHEAVEREIYWRNNNGRLGTLTPADKRNLVAFLESLTSETRAASQPADTKIATSGPKVPR